MGLLYFTLLSSSSSSSKAAVVAEFAWKIGVIPSIFKIVYLQQHHQLNCVDVIGGISFYKLCIDLKCLKALKKSFCSWKYVIIKKFVLFHEREFHVRRVQAVTWGQ